MDVRIMAKQFVNYNRTAFNNSFSALCLFQDQMAKVHKAMLEQSPVFTEESKAQTALWMESFNKSRDRLKSIADDNFKKLELFFDYGRN